MKASPFHPASWPRHLWMLCLLCLTAVQAAERYHPSRLLLKPIQGRADALDRFRGQRGHRLLRRLAHMQDLQLVELPPGTQVFQALQRYRQSGLCEFVEPDYRVWPAATPNDPRYLDGSLWHLNNTGQGGGQSDADLDAPEAWDTLSSASNIVVAVIDTGVRYTHEDLAPNMWINSGEIPNNGVDDDHNGYVDDVHGINAADGSGDPIDVDGHGTQVAGLIGARGNNGLGVTGVAWSAKIMACRFYDDQSQGYISDAAIAINYARQHGAQVINASFITTDFSSVLYSAINQCRTAGIVVVAAAGNDQIDTDLAPYYPASFDLDNIVAVLSTTRQDLLSSFSNYGQITTDLAAPGSSVYTTLKLNDSAYGLNSGTSFSAPLVAGAFALMYARYPGETYRQLVDRVYAAVDPLPALQGRCVTGGRLNLAKALGPSVVADFAVSRTAGQVPFSVSFTNTSFGTITNWHWDFGDGVFSDEASPEHVYQYEGDYTATLSVESVNGLASSQARTLSALAGYTVVQDTYDWIDPSGMTPLPLGNSGVSDGLPLPFEFLFYGRAVSQFYVGADGLLGFTPLTLPANTSLPNPAAPNDIICPFWDDLRPGAAGTIYFGVTGEAPDRRLVVSWVGVRHAAFPFANYTFQAVLAESSHQIHFQYQAVEATNDNPGREGRSATIGLEHRSGQVADLYSLNGSALLQNGQALLFQPTTFGEIRVSPAAGLITEAEVGGNPLAGSQLFTLNNAGTGALSWRVNWSAPWLECLPAQGELGPGMATNILMRFTEAAQALPPGVHAGVLQFENVTSGVRAAQRTITLRLAGAQGLLLVSPGTSLEFLGAQRGPFSPDSVICILTNAGDYELEWAATNLQRWLSIEPVGGTLARHQTASVSIALNSQAAALLPGTEYDLVSFVNLTSGLGGSNILVALDITPLLGALEASPTAPLESRGRIGGPIRPAQQVYLLTNSGGLPLNWTALGNVPWLGIFPPSGSLGPGEQTEITVNFTAEALLLDLGDYSGQIEFRDTTTSSEPLLRTARLKVEAPFNLEITLGAQTFDLLLHGLPETDYVLQATTNLLDWVDLSTYRTDGSGTVLIPEPLFNGEGVTAFRARTLDN